MADSGISRCAVEAVAEGKNAVTLEDARALLSLVDERAERIARETGAAPADAARQAGQQLADMEAASAAIQRRNALLNLATRTARMERIEQIAAETGKDGKLNLAHAVANMVTAKNAVAQGSRASAERTWNTVRARNQAALTVALEKAGLAKAFRNGILDRQWGRELFELSRKAAADPEARPGITGDSAALRIAQIVYGLQQASKQRLNGLGTWIGDYSGRITRTVHDMDKIRRAGFEAWRDFIEPRLDERTFEGVEDRDAFLRSTWNALSTGVHLADTDFIGMKDAAFTGPRNLAEKLSEGRKLHFRDGDAWMDYQQRFGRGTLADQVMADIDRNARDEALLSRWGTNPQAEFDADFKRLEQKYQDIDGDAVRELRERQASIQQRFDYLTGKANVPANQMAAGIMAGVRAVENFAKLGMVAFTHLSVFPSKAAEVRYLGVGWLEAYRNSIESLFQGRGQGEVRELSDLLLAGVEGAHHDMMSRFYADDHLPGRLAKIANTYFRLTGLTYLVNAEKAGTMRLMARYLGRNVGTEFDELSPELQRTLKIYDISPAEWDALRNAEGHMTVDGRVHLTPDAAMRASDEAILATKAGMMLPDSARPLMRGAAKEVTPEMLQNIRQDLAVKLHSLYADTADRGVITPGIEERAMFRGGAPGSVGGELMRTVMQFKMWGAAAIRQGMGRELFGGQGGRAATAGMFHLLLMGTVMGYLTMTLKDIFKGLMPRDPTNPETLFAAAMQGGGFGILGDYAFGEASRFGQSPVESLAGPVIGTGGDIIKLIQQARGLATEDPNVRASDVGSEAVQLAKNNAPFINMFYLRRALDYLALHSLQETMNPGYLRRAERSLQKRTGQTYFLPPTVHMPTFGR